MIPDLFNLKTERMHSKQNYPVAVLICEMHLYLCGTYFTPIEMLSHVDLLKISAYTYLGLRMFDRYWIPMNVMKGDV